MDVENRIVDGDSGLEVRRCGGRAQSMRAVVCTRTASPGAAHRHRLKPSFRPRVALVSVSSRPMPDHPPSRQLASLVVLSERTPRVLARTCTLHVQRRRARALSMSLRPRNRTVDVHRMRPLAHAWLSMTSVVALDRRAGASAGHGIKQHIVPRGCGRSESERTYSEGGRQRQLQLAACPSGSAVPARASEGP